MKKLMFMAACVAVALSSCSENEVYTNQSASNAIQFSTYSSNDLTRGTVTSVTSDFSIGMLAYDQGASGAFSDSELPDFMYNQQVTATVSGTTTWNYSPIKYWSSDANNTYSFFAYAPYVANTSTGITLSGNNVAGAPTIQFAIQDADEMVDLVAGQTINVTKAAGSAGTAANTVDINLKHQLTRVAFEAVSVIQEDTDGADDTYIVITGFNILGSSENTSANKKSTKLYSGATYTFYTTTTDDSNEVHTQDGKWSDYTVQTTALDVTPALNMTTTAIGDYETSGVRVKNGTATATNLMGENQYLFLIPATTPYDTNGDIATSENSGLAADDMYVELTYDIVTEDTNLDAGYAASSIGNVATVALTAETLKQGYAYKFTFTISGSTDDTESALDAVIVNASVLEWDTSEELEDSSDNEWEIDLL